MNQTEKSPAKYILIGIAALVALVLLAFTNPFAWNDGGERTVVQQTGGKQFVEFNPGIFYAGFFAKQTVWPNQISVSYQDSTPNLAVEDNSIEIGQIKIRFGNGDASTADVKGITQYILPLDEKDMILIHNTHRTPISLVTKRLAPYTKECLQSSAQLMSSEMHYSGGRAQMTQDFIDQLKNGSFLLTTKEESVFDTINKENKRVYKTINQYEKDGTLKRKVSSIKEYGITVADAQVTDVDYEPLVKQMLAKKIESNTKASVSRQELVTAQQQALTAKAQGEKALVDVEYAEKKKQTQQVVAAQTLVELAKQDLTKQDIALQASYKEALKIKTLADAKAYEKRAIMNADGALSQKFDAWKFDREKMWEAFGKFTGNLVPTYQINGSGAAGAGNMNAFEQFQQIQNILALKQLGLDMSAKK